MVIRLACVLLAAVLGVVANGQETIKVPVTIKAALVDRDLNQKPVAEAKFTIISAESNPGNVLGVATNFDGSAQIFLPVGKYRIVSVQPLDFQAKRYSWNVEVTVSSPSTAVELSNDNAMTSDSPTAVAVDDLVSVYKKYRNSVVTVLAEYGPAKGTGFIIDQSGLVLTDYTLSPKRFFYPFMFPHLQLKKQGWNSK